MTSLILYGINILVLILSLASLPSASSPCEMTRFVLSSMQSVFGLDNRIGLSDPTALFTLYFRSFHYDVLVYFDLINSFLNI